ncbi:MAG: hypothetical protein J3K34DRAFT_429253 [Monoraphidium minutum]|nr:MAG: hypothetical protein J3K34DRAFT_429253 [Monoraphidium minutum]
MSPARLLLAALCAALLAVQAHADPTSALMSQLQQQQDPAGCGELLGRCCMRKGAAARCSSRQLACVPLEGAQNLRCHACGDEGEPACDGGACNDATLQAFLPGGRTYSICVRVATEVAPVDEATVSDDKRGNGGGRRNPPGKLNAKERRREKQRLDSERGRQARGIGCGAAAPCRGRQACFGAVCVACGAPGQPCCDKGAACRQFGAGGAVQCVDDAAAGAKMCRPAAAEF